MRRTAIAFALASLWWSGNGLAVERLQAQLVPTALRGRNHAPLPVEVTFRWSGTGLLEGRLELEFWNGNRLLNRYHSMEITLTGGEQRFGLLLPPFPTTYDSQVDVAMRFASSKSRFDLGTSTLLVSSPGERSMVMGVCDSAGSSDAQMLRIEQRFRPARFQTLATEFNPQAVNVSLVRLAPDEMTAQPLSYCAYDLIVLTASGFTDLHERQRQALLRWVRAGGSLCLFTENGPRPLPQEFLNALGKGPEVDGIQKIYAGLGRCVLINNHPNDGTDLNSPSWSGAVDFLWKMRAQTVQEVHTNLSYKEALREELKTNRGGYAQYPFDDQTSAGRFAGGDLREGLLPQDTRFIPLRSLAGILTLFVLMIGPVDYAVLGWLSRRRYTWILFPVMTAAFTVATVWMANRYLGYGDHRRALVFVDIGDHGVVLRHDRYELLFAGHDQSVAMNVQDGLWAPLEHTILARERLREVGYSYFGRPGQMESEGTPPLCEGTIPGRFHVEQLIHQWQPQLNRILTLDPPPTSIAADWDAVNLAILQSSDTEHLLSATLFRQPRGDLFLLHGTNVVCVERGMGLLPPSLISASCTGGSNGLFSIVAQVSPSGGGNFEDLAVLDESDPGQWMVVVVTQVGEDIVVYRRVYHVEG